MSTVKIQRNYICGECVTEVDNVCCPDFCETDAGIIPPVLIGHCGYLGPCCPCPDDTSGTTTIVSAVTTIISGATRTMQFVDTDYTLDPTDQGVVVDTTTTGRTVTLFSAAESDALNLRYYIKNKLPGTNDLTVQLDGSDTIDGDSNPLVLTPLVSITLITDGTSNWSIL